MPNADATSSRSSKAAARLHAELEQSLRNLVTSDDWLEALDTARRFHGYSFANTRLIWAQAAARGFTPTRVCGYRVWQSLGRQVRRGEKGIAILAPIVHRVPTTNPSDLKREIDIEDRRVAGFRMVHVFDVSQTEGAVLKEIRPVIVDGDLPTRWSAVVDLVARHGYAVEVSEDPRLDDANGTIWGDRHVVVRESLPGAQRYKTAIHELAHIRLHDPKGGDRPACRGIVEVEAESVAYIVSAATGIDAAGYSLPYVAAWSGGNPEVVAKTAQRVVTCASGILDQLGVERRQEREIGDADEPTVLRTLGEAIDRTTMGPSERADAGLARLEEAVHFAADHYHRLLQGPEGASARRYLEHRGINLETAERFEVGVAPPQWDALTLAMRRAGFTDRELIDAGVSAQGRNGNVYDRMRSRIVFPVHDSLGRHRGVAGRLLEGDGPKYMNTPETAIYHKGRLLYGLHHALTSIEESGHAVVVEGYLDVVANLHRADAANSHVFSPFA